MVGQAAHSKVDAKRLARTYLEMLVGDDFEAGFFLDSRQTMSARTV